jgi:hypothetical protein
MVRAHLVNIEDYDIEGPTISAIDAALAAPEAGSQS